MAGGGQDRACALGWGEVIHPNRPKTVARYHTIPQISYECFKTDQGGYMRRGIMYPPWSRLRLAGIWPTPRRRIEGEQARNLIEAKAHDAE